MAVYGTDFSELLAGTPLHGNGWTAQTTPTDVWVATTDAAATGGRIARYSRATNVNAIISHDGASADAGAGSGEVLLRFRRSAGTQSFGVQAVLRGSGIGYYVATSRFTSGNIDLEVSKFTGGSTSTLSTANIGFDLVSNTWYWLRFRANGSALKAKLWRDSEEEPAGWHVEATDSGLTSGWMGFRASNSGDWDVDRIALATGGDTAGFNRPPLAPTLLVPADGATFDRAVAQRFTWTFNDPDWGDSQSAYNLRHRPTGTTTWTETGWVTSASTAHDFPPGYFPAENYEWQVATKDSQGETGPFSASGFFTATSPPPGPTITAPANNGTISTDTATLVWSTPDQEAYQAQILAEDAVTVLFDTGTVQSSGARSRVLDFPDNNVTRVLRVRTRFAGLWSPWSTVTVTVSYNPPSPPTLAVLPDSRTGSITVTATYTAPSGDEPTVVSHDIHVREVGDTSDGTRICADCPPQQQFTWWLPASGVGYSFRVRSIAENGTRTFSEWTE